LNLWLRLGSENAITLRAWLLLAPISIFLTAAFVPEGSSGNYLNWLLVGTLAHLATGAVLLIARYSFLNNKPRKPRPLAAVVTFLVAGTVRGATVSFTTQLFGLIESPEYLLRMRSGAVLVLFWFAFAAIIIDASLKYRTAYEDLQTRIKENQLLEESINESIAGYRTRIIDEISGTISTAFQRTSSHHQLADVIDEAVRPLSKELFESKEYPEIELRAAKAKNQPRRISFASTAKTMLTTTPFNPLTVALISLGGTISSRLWTAPIDSVVLDVLLNFFWITVSLGVARHLTRNRPKLSAVVSIPIWLVVSIISALITQFTSTGLLQQDPTSTALLGTNVLFVGVFAAALYAYEIQRQEKIDQLATALDQASWLRAKAKQGLWSERRRLARLLHSGVQSRILATASRLGRSSAAGELSQVDLELLRKDCADAMLATESPEPLANFLADSKEVWAGAVEIDSKHEQEVLEALTQDRKAAIATLEVVREAINNAVKHSEASTINIDFALSRSNDSQMGAIDLRIANNGVLPQQQKHSTGIGSQVIDEVSEEWSLESDGDQTILRVRIPVELKQKVI
jgi:signal transduction histidine kinase